MAMTFNPASATANPVTSATTGQTGGSSSTARSSSANAASGASQTNQATQTNSTSAQKSARAAAEHRQTAKTANVQKQTDRPQSAGASDDAEGDAGFAGASAQTLNAQDTQAKAEGAATPVTTSKDLGDVNADMQAIALQMVIVAPVPNPATQPAPASTSAAAQSTDDVLSAVTSTAVKDVMTMLSGVEDDGADQQSPVDAKAASNTQTPFTLPTGLVDNRPATSAANADAAARPIASQVGTQAWADEVGTRVSILAAQGHQSASLKLSPEHLGPLEVRISIRDDQASVWFGAAHADTRAAIENALPRLREQFAAQGLSLADAGVFREPPRDNTRQAFSGSSTSSLASNDQPIETSMSVVARRLGLVDAYA